LRRKINGEPSPRKMNALETVLRRKVKQNSHSEAFNTID